MPGLIGTVYKTPPVDLKQTFDRLLEPMLRGGRLQAESQISSGGRWAIGRVHLGVFQPEAQLAKGQRLSVLFHGELDNEADLAAQVYGEENSGPNPGVSSILRDQYEKKGVACFPDLKGAFCAALIDEASHQLILVNDLLGSYPLYWFADGNHFIFASEMRALVRDSSVRPQLNPMAMADFFSIGFLVGDKTVAESVQMVPPGSILTYDWREGRCQIQRYARIENFFQSWQGTRAEYQEALRSAFNHRIEQGLQYDNAIGLSLSGGLDSRAILSATTTSPKTLTTYTLGVKGCADEVIAQELAAFGGTRHEFYEMNESYLGEFSPNLKSMMELTDGMYMTHGLTEMLALKLIEKSGLDVLLRGHGAELAKASLAWPLHTDGSIFQMKTKAEFVTYMLTRVNYISGSAPLRSLFTKDWWASMENGARQSMEASLADVDLPPADLCSYLYLIEHHRRFTVPSLELFRNFVEIRLPFVDADFLKVLLSGPAEWRDSTEIHRHIIGQNHPAMLRVRNSNTGAPGDSGPFVEMFLDKVNSILKRLNVYGYRHYHTFDLWMQQSLISVVEKVLLDSRTLSRGMFHEPTLRQMVADSREGRADYAYLFQILLILELWQREYQCT